MAAVTIAEALAAEATAKANGWTEEHLLNLAGERLGIAIGRFFPRPGQAIGYLGKGHNAGDTLVALRILRDRFGWKVATRNAYPISDFAQVTLKKWDELGLRRPLDRMPAWRDIEEPLILLDGLVGTGISGPLRDPLLALAREMESLRQNAGARVAAVDFPSGIDADSGEIFPGAVTADVTFTIANAKTGILTGAAASAVGAIAMVPVESLMLNHPTEMDVISPQTMAFGKAPRPFDFHKGQAGRVSVVAGSATYPGAGVLAASGALRGGAGLVTLHVPHAVVATVHSMCPTEIMVRGYSNPAEILDFRFDSLVIGCGLGVLESGAAAGMLELLFKSPRPLVVDADALNLIAKHREISRLGANAVLTPHPGEFLRLAPDLAGQTRESAARIFADRTEATLLLKGSRTIITRKGLPIWCNSTGSPGMACGGQGDLLAGVIGALLAAGGPTEEAAARAAWLCGRAAEVALNSPEVSEESLTPRDVVSHLGAAFLDWKASRR